MKRHTAARRYANDSNIRKLIKGGIWSGTLPPARRYANDSLKTKSVKGGKMFICQQ